jgi:hypothetical protein
LEKDHWFIEYNPDQKAFHIDNRITSPRGKWIIVFEIYGLFKDAASWTNKNRERIKKEFKSGTYKKPIFL